MYFLSLTLSIFFLSQVSWGQVDASSALLLQPSPQTPPTGTGLESGRYKVKRSKVLPGKKINSLESDSNSTLSTSTSVVVSPMTAASTTITTSSTSTSTTNAAPKKAKSQTQSEMEVLLFSKQTPAPLNPEKPIEKMEVVESVEIQHKEMEEPSVSEQVREIVAGDGQPRVEAYKEQIHPDDIRLNQIEIDVLPGAVSNNSKSSYSVREYSSFSPKLQVGAHFWMTPFLGIYGEYLTSMSADVAGDSVTNSRVTVHHEWTEIGFNVRKFFGMSRKANSLEFGIHLSEYKFGVPGDDVHRIQLQSSGLGLHLLSRIPVAPSYSWVFGGKLIPRVQHKEQGTGLNASSGSGGESSRIDVKVGGEFKLARQNQVIWDITSSFEKNQFHGEASINDPETGLKPKSVSVANTFILFTLGYRWGQ